MLGALNSLAMGIGYTILTVVVVVLLAGYWMDKTVDSEVSDEAKEMAEAVDPNNSIDKEMAAVVAEGVLSGIRDLRPNETIRADPPPLTYFDWSATEMRQEDIEHILQVLQRAGYHTHPLPEMKNWDEKMTWSRERAGIWRSEPDWHIVEFDEETGEKTIKEEVDLPLPERWEPDT